MNPPDEHDDDLEPEVIEGAAIETEENPEDEDEEPGPARINWTGAQCHARSHRAVRRPLVPAQLRRCPPER